jgi:cytochrome b6-f complex iron-sulfur subunit
MAVTTREFPVASLTKKPSGLLQQGRSTKKGMDVPGQDPCSTCMSRRALLRGVATASAGAVSVSLSLATLSVLPAGCMQGNSAPTGPIAAGNVADIQVGSLNLVAGENLILGRDDLGLFAMTRVCTHQGQLVNVVSVAGGPALHCYAHGSEFNMNGGVTHGPAVRPLEHFKVEVAADGSITIQAGEVVTADVRAPAP